MFKYKGILISMAISLLLVVITPFFSVENVNNLEQLNHVSFGVPFGFIQQQLNLTPSVKDFPIRLTLLSPWENQTSILFGNFILSWIIVFLIIIVIKALIKKQV